MTNTETWQLAAELAEAYASRRYAGGVDIYKPQWYRAAGKRYLGLRDCGTIAAIRSGDPVKMRAALDALLAYDT